MSIKHEAAILNLFADLKEVDPQGRAPLYDSLALLIEDLKLSFTDKASNALYMKEKADLFLGACRVIAGIEQPPNSLVQSISYAEANLLDVRSLAQWK